MTKLGRPPKYNEDVIIPKVLDFMLAQQLTETKWKTKHYRGEPYEEESEVAGLFPSNYLLARHLGINVDTLKDWANKHEAFSAVFKEYKELQKHFIIQNTLRKFYSENFAMFVMQNMFGWSTTPKVRVDIANLADDDLLKLGKLAFTALTEKEA